MSRSATTPALVLLLLLAGCGAAQETGDSHNLKNPGIIEATTDIERAVLEAAPAMSEGDKKTVSGHEVTILREYPAASGRTCRSILIADIRSGDSAPRLICLFDGHWKFAPEVQP